MIEEQVPSFPIYVTLPVWGVVLLFVLGRVSHLRDLCATFLLLATWFRYSIASFHQYTYLPVVLGLSVIALTSIGVVAVGCLVVGGRNLLLRRLIPIYITMLVVLVSGIANQRWIEGVNATFKWLYLVVFALAAHQAMRQRGSEPIFRSLAVIFAGPVILQWLSVLLDLKVTNPDGTFYIGGYQHQQGLSIILLTFLYITCFSPSLGLLQSYGRLVIVAAGLALANYRTAVLAAAVPASTVAVSRLVERFVPKQRGIVVVFLAVVTVFVFVGVGTLARERFADLGTTLDKGASLIKPAEHFTTEDKRLFSGRLYLWSQYIEAFLDGDIVNILVGFGPDAWVGRFTTYAHNTFISYLYEFGLFGLAGLVWILSSNLLTALRVRDDRRLVLVACHIGFIVLNLATMGIWTLEGAVLYGLLLSQTWYLDAIRVDRSDTHRVFVRR
jgi:O-antigen ligase/polysaccharide polymerase Wzy-like membrane protein